MKPMICRSKEYMCGKMLELDYVYWVDEAEFDGKHSTITVYKDSKKELCCGEYPRNVLSEYTGYIDGLWFVADMNNCPILLKDVLDFCEENKYYTDEDDTRNVLWYILDNNLNTEDNMNKSCKITRMDYKWAEQNNKVAEFRKYQGFKLELLD